MCVLAVFLSLVLIPRSDHCEMIDRMGLDQDSVMIIHGGGVFQDKPATLLRLKENYVKLPENVKGRLVLENDEICYNVDDLLPVCEDRKRSSCSHYFRLQMSLLYSQHSYGL